MVQFMKDGLQDISFSREKTKLPWGVPVPGDENQVMYVWCDALTNYLTGAGLPDGKWQDRWPAYLHVVGKDIARFHAIIWVGMLLSAGFEIPKNLLVHGFVTDADGRKMGKSLGNGVDPMGLVAEFGGDAVRYFLATEAGPGYDIGFTVDRLKAVFNDQLANNAGNFASRTCAMFAKAFPEGVEVPANYVPDAGFTDNRILVAHSNYASAMAGFDVRGAVQSAFALLDDANAFLNRTEPWKVKDDAARLRDILLMCMEINYHVTQMLSPVLPNFAEKMRPALGFADFKIDANFGFVASHAGKVMKISKPEIVFQRKA
jgi:methionyl-tRNA synthetase